MAIKLRKPILVGGIGISLALWLWQSFQESIVEIGELSLVGTIAVGIGLWFLQTKVSQHKSTSPLLIPLTQEAVLAAIAQAKGMVAQLATEATDRDITTLKQQIAQLPQSCQRQSLQIAIIGGPKVGKSQLKQLLEKSEIAPNLSFIEAEALSTATNAPQVQTTADAALFLTNGDLTESEWQLLQQLSAARQRVLLLFNKQDRYVPEERALILQQLRQRVRALIPPEDAIAIAAAPTGVKVRQHQEDGTVKEWTEPLTPDIEILRERLQEIIAREHQQLIWATTWREAGRLKAAGKGILNEIRRDRALPIIEQYQWVAAAAAFANPVTALDLLATAAINAQMLVDLSAIYQQKFSLSQAQAAAGTIGKLMVKLGLVELSTQAIANLLKSNAVTYVAGGGVQGISAAYLTRLAGLSLIEYFQERELSEASGEGFNWDKLAQKLQQVFQQNQRASFLPHFVKQAVAEKL